MRTGLKSDRVEITVHKFAGGVRFGWKELESQVLTTEKQGKPLIDATPSICNRGKRPKLGTKCSYIWEWLDKHPSSKLNDVKIAGVAFGWNMNTVIRQFYLCKAAEAAGQASNVAGRHPKAP